MLYTLINFTFLFSAILVKEKDGKKIPASLRKKIVKLTKDHGEFKKLLKTPANEKRHHLLKLKTIFHILLKPLFEK